MLKEDVMIVDDIDNQKETVDLLQIAYRMEIESTINYLSNSIHLDGILAEVVKNALSTDVNEELGHAKLIAKRIKQLGGRIPSSLDMKFDQFSLQTPFSSVELIKVIQGVIEAERDAIIHYRHIIAHCASIQDPVTADLVTRILAEEEEHCTLFEGYLKELTMGV
jgi:bacterioferritin